MNDRPSILITGGAGFIGCAISDSLVEDFGEVIVVDNLHPQVHAIRARPSSLHAAVRFVEGDVTDATMWDGLLSEFHPDVVIHLAAETGTGQSLAEATRHADVNVVGTTQMLDALNRNDALPSRIVLTSSRAVYGEGAWRSLDNGALTYPGQRPHSMLARGEWDFPDAEPIAMSADLVGPAPASVYAATKLAQEHLLQVWCQALGVEPFILRLQNVYGPGQSLSNPYTGIMSLFCRMAKGGQSIPLFEDGKVRRDFVLIDDVARAVVGAASAESAPSLPVDIGSGEMQTIETAATLIAARYGAPAPHVTGQFRDGDVRHAWADISRASSLLDWSPRYSLEQGVERLASWIDTQDVPPL